MLTAVRDGVGYIVVWPPVQCGCGRMASFVVNREGRSRCLECDAKQSTRSA